MFGSTINTAWVIGSTMHRTWVPGVLSWLGQPKYNQKRCHCAVLLQETISTQGFSVTSLLSWALPRGFSALGILFRTWCSVPPPAGRVHTSCPSLGNRDVFPGSTNAGCQRELWESTGYGSKGKKEHQSVPGQFLQNWAEEPWSWVGNSPVSYSWMVRSISNDSTQKLCSTHMLCDYMHVLWDRTHMICDKIHDMRHHIHALWHHTHTLW